MRRAPVKLILAAFVLALIIPATHTARLGAEEIPERIVSLAPNMTELAFALGLGDRVVGVTSYCDYPPEAKERPKVGGMSNPSLEAVLRLKPDVALMTTDGNPKDFERKLRKFGIETYVFRARRVHELPGAVRRMGRALGVADRGEALAADIENKLRGFKERSRSTRKLKVLYVVWPEPLMAAGPGTAVDDAISILGHRNVAAGLPSPYPKYSLEEIVRQSPDVIVFGKGEGMKSATEGLLKRLRSLPAVKAGRVKYAGDSLYRLGPRVIEGIEELGRLIEEAAQ